MRTYPLRHADGQLFAFEVENAYIGSGHLAEVLAAVDGVTDAGLGRGTTGDPDVRAWFVFRGRPGVVLEPFGDNSRYWVGPAGGLDAPEASLFDVGPLEAAVRAYRVPPLRRALADLVSLRLPFRSAA